MQASQRSTNEDAALTAGEYLTFILGSEEYGVEILKVQEIRSYETVTKIVNTPDFIKGVINLRGNIVPIVDLRMRFNLAQVNYNEFTVVIMLSLKNRTIGIVVDGVSDVLELKESQISPVPELVSSIDNKYLLGLGTVGDRMLTLVDIELLMSSEEMALIEAASENIAQETNEITAKFKLNDENLLGSNTKVNLNTIKATRKNESPSAKPTNLNRLKVPKNNGN